MSLRSLQKILPRHPARSPLESEAFRVFTIWDFRDLGLRDSEFGDFRISGIWIMFFQSKLLGFLCGSINHDL